jgi:hypothetical protein
VGSNAFAAKTIAGAIFAWARASFFIYICIRAFHKTSLVYVGNVENAALIELLTEGLAPKYGKPIFTIFN